MSVIQEIQNSITLYIPRILGNIKQTKIINVFEKLEIGKVFYIDMHYRINENKHPYYFVFISIKLFNTSNAIDFYNKLNQKGVINLYYNNDKIQYWQIKRHITREMRNINIPLHLCTFKSPTSMCERCDADCVFTTELMRNGVHKSFTMKDKFDLEKEYDELQKEIFNMVLYSHWF